MPVISADQSARQRALDPSVSFIVQAPAGSGKTELLIQRYLKLLAHVDQPEAVVAITFTKKAAAEMRSRVLAALRDAERGVAPLSLHQQVTSQLAQDVLARDRRAGWHLLQNPSRLPLQTIDALCAHITRQMPWLARFGAPPEITEKADALYREAARHTLLEVEKEERAGADGPISRLLLHLDNDFGIAEKLIARMLETRDQWLRLTGVNPDIEQVRVELEGSLREAILRTLSKLHACFPVEIRREFVRVGEVPCVPEPVLEHRPHWQTLLELLLTKKNEWRKTIVTVIPRASLMRLQRSDALLAALKDLCALPPPCFDDKQWRAMEAVIQILPKAVAELQMVFRKRGTVDFAELSICSLQALGKVDFPTDLALSLGYRLEHLLIDEFQDTSYTHFELLQKLTAGWDPGDARTLFLVGDPMQSIYRFRQAEVGLFLKARQQGIGSIRLEPLTLHVNFRSAPPIVDWVNQTFADMFPCEEHIDSGAVTYTRSSAHATEPGHATPPRVHPFLGDSQAEEAECILSLLASGRPGTTGVLVRARSHLASLVPMLREQRIAFQAIEIDQLGDRPLIQDLMALTFALVHLADRIAWLAILRAPWCGLLIKDLHALSAEDHHSAIWDLLQAQRASLSTDAGSRLERVLPVLASALEQRGRTGLRNLVEQTWIRLGGPACVALDSDLEDAAAYFDLLEGLEQGGELGDFRALREQVEGLFAQPDSRADGTLQVMTIHKAKGLEFDTVILPGLGQRPRPDENALLTWSEQEGKLLFAPIAASGSDPDGVCKYLSHLEKQKNENETKRLLYVAVTRARTQLHLLGCARRNDKAGEPAAAHSGSLLQLLWPAVGREFVNKALATPALALIANSADQQQRLIRRVPANWMVPSPPHDVFWKAERVEPVTAPQIAYDWAGDHLRHVGTVVHAYLQRVARESLAVWTAGAIRSHRAGFQALLADLGVSPVDLQQASDRVEAGLRNALRDPRGQWLLEAHAEAQSEYAVTGVIGGRTYQAVLDRTFVDEAGVRWIVDFKTSSHSGSDLETFLDSEQLQYREQLERYALLMVQADDRPIRLGLYFPLLNGWREWAAPTVKRRQAGLFE